MIMKMMITKVREIVVKYVNKEIENALKLVGHNNQDID